MTPKKRNHKKKYSFGFWLILAVLLLTLIAVESFAIYTIFTNRFTSGNDFFVRWLGGREYLLNGTNPYDQSVAEQAQIIMFGRIVGPEIKDQAYFAYPLYTLYFFWPLSLLPYPWAQALWMTLLQLMLMGVTFLAIKLSAWNPPRWLFWGTIFWGIFFYNGGRAILLGQFSILVALALFWALWSIRHNHEGWAGIFLAVSTIKPQMVLMILVFLLVWALFQRRWKLIISFALSMLVLVVSGMILLPSWPLDFVRNAIAYSEYVAHGTPLQNLLHYFLPSSIADALTLILSFILFVAILPGWWLAWRSKPGAYSGAIMVTLIVSSLITFRSATTNQIILYLPLFLWFRRWVDHPPFSKKRWANLSIACIELGLLLLMWVVFAITLEGNYEHIMMHGLLPALMLLLYIIDWRSLRQTVLEEPLL